MQKYSGLLAVLVFVAAQASAEDLVSHWVQMAPGGEAELRAVTRAPSCPQAVIDGKNVAMQVRASPDKDFPVLVCAVTILPGAMHASLNGIDVVLPKPAPERILVFGDTGCRIKGKTIQNCNDPASWPFPQVAAEAARLKPDLVLHLGDYLYRESPCPPGNAGCAGSPWGDNWDAWAADFFTPARPLLEAAPWVIVRGNHEDCHRAGRGFLRLLGPLAVVEGAACADHVGPYAVPLGAVNLIVTDNASAEDTSAPDDLVNTYQADYAALPGLAKGPQWVAGHHPIWGVVRLQFGMVVGGNDTLEHAEDRTGLADNVDLLLSGHIHTFEAIDYEKGLPPQLIVGEGGDKLDDAPANLTGFQVGVARISKGLSLPGWGFLTMTHERADRWRIDVYSSSGAHERTCSFAQRRIDCQKS